MIPQPESDSMLYKDWLKAVETYFKKSGQMKGSTIEITEQLKDDFDFEVEQVSEDELEESEEEQEGEEDQKKKKKRNKIV